MPPQPNLQKRINNQLALARRYRQLARQEHLKAAWLARQALLLSSMERPILAQRTMQMAMAAKTRAVQLGARARAHAARAAALRKSRTATQ
jgi:hypothetical protein